MKLSDKLDTFIKRKESKKRELLHYEKKLIRSLKMESERAIKGRDARVGDKVGTFFDPSDGSVVIGLEITGNQGRSISKQLASLFENRRFVKSSVSKNTRSGGRVVITVMEDR